ncbi:selection and upkeep of intraepithelial T-cells protein 7-like isoform X1 [Astatotilapia calliptera]|uniref:selection and upkeep of intraepithelial T-cells protein 7-like isoform X1 n=1 Tax=Astatotilapia calliptera TaxID=8154 RepID=UPI000E40D996|nr:selection and upkeep of intraepithelial T-cells protein 7-like isoform X1 [Astatotilapia calliptera]
MPAGKSSSLCQILLSVCLLFSSTDGKIIKAESGQNVSLPCQTPNISMPIRAVEWFRLDLQEGHVLMYRGEQFISFNQLPSFVNRVDLQDRQMKDGDVSLTLKDVTSDDTGTFQCYVVQRGTNGRKSIFEYISTVYLRVVPPGQPGGHRKGKGNEDVSSGLDFCLTVSVILVTLALAFFMTFTIPKTQEKKI